METVKGKYPISTNMGSAKNWLDKDGNPQPDCQMWLLKLLACFPFGLDHFYLRSPLTAIPKMILGAIFMVCAIYPVEPIYKTLSLFGAGTWWMWDMAQLFTEGDRVLQYGMATPFDFYTGIGQGMITDKSSQYVTEASYPMWLVGIALGFCGLDSLIAQNGGQALRKVTEFALFVWCAITVANFRNTGFSGGWITALVFGVFLGTIIIAEYFAVAGIVFGGEPFVDGIKFSNKQDNQYNSFFSWLIKNTFLDDVTKAKVIKDLAYGGISAATLKAMFEIKHKTESHPDKEPVKKEDGTWISYVIMLAAPFLILMNWIIMGCQAIYFAIFPAAAVMAAQSKATLKAMEAQSAAVAAANPASLAAGLGIPTPASVAASLPPVPTQASVAASLGVPTQASVAASLGVPSLPPKPTKPKPVAMKGGAREDLSLESQIMGVSIVALIAGGSLKGIVDYLMTE